MSNRWQSNEFAKIHEDCGGLVRWVEAYDDPFTGYNGECLECGEDRIVVEDIIPIRCDPDEIGMEMINDVEIETLRELEWDEDDEWSHNQERLRRAIA